MNMKFVRTWVMLALVMVIGLSVTGGTIAWFTDSVTSSANVIQAGNLDVDVYYEDEKSIEKVDTLFNDVALWEPGAVAWENLTVVNKGNLALKYEMTMNTSDFNSVDGNDLTGALKIGFVEGGVTSDNRDTVIGQVNNNWSTFSGFNAADTLYPSGSSAGASSKTYGVVVYWEPTAEDNKWNVNNNKTVDKLTSDGKNQLYIDLGVKLLATQLTYESDSFDDQYDEGASFEPDTSWYNETAAEFSISTAEELSGLAKLVNSGTSFKGKTVKLASDINLKNALWTPIGNSSNGFEGTFDGNNKTISNYRVEGKINVGLFGYALNGGNIKNLNVKNATIKGDDYAGAILGRGYTDVVNCHVENVTVIVKPYLTKDGVYDGGAKAGGVVGQLLEGAGNTMTNCTAKSVKIIGYRDIGAVLGMAHNNNTVTNCEAYDSEVSYLYLEPGQNYAESKRNENIGEVVGRVQDTASVTGSKSNNVKTNSVYVYGLTLVPDGNNSKIIVNDKEGFLNLTKLSNDWAALFTDGNGTTYTNYASGAGEDYYYSGRWTVSLEADIDLNNKTIDPVKLWFGERTGAPTFNGNNHTIKNAKIVTDATTENEAGLFNASDVKFKNLKLDNIHVTGSNVGNSTAGVLSGSCNAPVSDITITNSSVTNGKYTGGIVGYGYTTITGCTVKGTTVKGGYKLGGLIGYICASGTENNVTGNTIENCTVNGNDGVYAGGKSEYIVGKLVGNYNCNGSCTGNTVTNVTSSATDNIGQIENDKTVTQ